MTPDQVTQEGFYWYQGKTGWSVARIKQEGDYLTAYFTGDEIDVHMSDLVGCVLVGPIEPPKVGGAPRYLLQDPENSTAENCR